MLRSILAATVATAALLGASAAHAGTHWSIGINVPLPGVVVSNGGYYAEPAPVYYAPPPPPVYVPAPRYYPRPVYYAPPPPPRVIYSTSYERRWDDRRWDDRHDHRGGWDRGDRDGRDGPHRGR